MLPDHLRPGLLAVFCGNAAGSASARKGHYYAGPGNKFWRTLYEVGLTPRQLSPSEDLTILEYELGLTDVCKVRAGSDREVGTGHWDVAGLVAKLDHYTPKWIAFNGKTAARAALGAVDHYGEQPEGLSGVRVFVLPSTSGAARRYWSIDPWREFARLANAERR